MRRLATIGAALLLLSCGGNRQGRFREIADHANPIIIELKPAAAIILDEQRRSDVDGITKACLDSLGVAQQQGTVHFNDRSNGGNDKLGVAISLMPSKENVQLELLRK